MGGPSWQVVARKLAARMFHHAECSDHKPADPDPGCPFCADRAAYELFVEKDAAFEAKLRERHGLAAEVPERAHRTDVEIVSVRHLVEEGGALVPVEIPLDAVRPDRPCTCGAAGTGRGHSHGCRYWNEEEYRARWRPRV